LKQSTNQNVGEMFFGCQARRFAGGEGQTLFVYRSNLGTFIITPQVNRVGMIFRIFAWERTSLFRCRFLDVGCCVRRSEGGITVKLPSLSILTFLRLGGNIFVALAASQPRRSLRFGSVVCPHRFI